MDGFFLIFWCNFKLVWKGCDSFGLNWFFDVIKMIVDKNDEGIFIFFFMCLELVYSWYGLNDCVVVEFIWDSVLFNYDNFWFNMFY